jgi:hypothetical protein
MATKIRLDADIRFLCIQTMQTSSGWTVNPMLNFWVCIDIHNMNQLLTL